MPRRPRIVVLYHYQRPDDVVSARLYDDLCEGLARRGWEVEARPSNRACHEPRASFPLRERWNAVSMRRVWRPPLRQSSSVGRVLNATWLVSAWLTDLVTRRDPPDVVLVGTDPVLAVTLAAPLKRLRPRIRVAHWVFDVYPEAAVADGLIPGESAALKALTHAVGRGYAACDLIVDIGPRMRERLSTYPTGARRATVPPWALIEPEELTPPRSTVRHELFGADAELCLLHSGSFGRAHDSEMWLSLARRLERTCVRMGFAGRGHRIDALRRAVSGSAVRFHDFCSEAELGARLGAADVHLASLRPEWSGLVVPSKFFGALAAGRPVLFAGPPDSDLARWIEQLSVGWVLTPDRLEEVAYDLEHLAREPERLRALGLRCHEAYHRHFSRSRAIDTWSFELHEVLAGDGGRPRP